MRDVVPHGWLLGVDFGTSNTAAAHTNESTGAVQALPLSRAGNSMPSAVFAGAQIDVGEVALNRATDDPTGFIPTPKRLLTLGQNSFQLGHRTLPAHLVIAAVLRSVLIRAQQQHRGHPPAGLALTHPQEWSPQQIRVLTEAAEEIGYGPGIVTTVSEPIAAAHYYARYEQIPVGGRIAVFDFGGGTLDVAVLAATPNGTFAVLGARGDNALGGRNFDRAIREWVQDQLEECNPELQRLLAGAPLLDLRALEDSIRNAKELLSETPSAGIDVRVDGVHERLLLTRVEFEQLIAPEVARAVELTRAALAMAGGEPVRAIYLTGGSSRIPLVHNRLHMLGPIATLDDPKTVVAQGALTAVNTPRQAAPRPPAPQPMPGPIGYPIPRPAPRRRLLLASAATAAVLGVGAAALIIATISDRNNPVPSAHAIGPDTAADETGSAAVGPLMDTTSAPAAASVDLLTPAGVRSVIQAIRPLLNGTAVKEFDVYPDHAAAEAPTPANPKLWDEISYDDGSVTHKPGGTMDSDTDSTSNLADFDWDVLPKLLQTAQQTLDVPNPTSRYIIVGPDLIDNTPSIRVYLSDAYGGGYLESDTRGNVRKTFPRGS